MTTDARSALEIATAALEYIADVKGSRSEVGARYHAQKALSAMRVAPVLARDGWGAELLRVDRSQDEKETKL